MGGNLSGWEPKVQKVKSWWETIKQYYLVLTIIAASVGYGVNEGYKYWSEHKDEVPTNLVIPQPKTNLKSGSGLQFASEFSDNSLRADLIIPNQTVDVYKLVKISTTKSGAFYDLLVMTVQNGQIEFVDAVELKNGGWAFTGKPGQYSIRLVVFDPDTGFSASTGQVIIGNGPQPPPVNKPEITLTLHPSVIKLGETATISWSVKDATEVFFDAQLVPANGTKLVTGQSVGKIPFTMTANNSVGSAVPKTVVLDVTNVPQPPPVDEKYGFATSAIEAFKQIKPEYRHFAAKLADNFDAVASQAVSTDAYPTPNAMNTELAGRNRFTMGTQSNIDACMPFFKAWSDLAIKLNKENKLLNTKEAYAEAYRETAKGLRAVQ